MKLIKTSSIIAAITLVSACSTSKKVATTTPAPAPATSTTSMVMVKPVATGTQAAGDAELAAIQLQYKDATMEKLNEGHQLYTAGACVRCHGAESIYEHSATEWTGIIDRMAYKARITDAQKDAVTKYVFAIKATQGK